MWTYAREGSRGVTTEAIFFDTACRLGVVAEAQNCPSIRCVLDKNSFICAFDVLADLLIESTRPQHKTPVLCQEPQGSVA
jgi:hypothetical protein